MMKFFKNGLLLLGFICASWRDPGDLINLRNPSFEDTPRASASPLSWYSNTAGSTPDILPGAWNIQSPKAYDGNTYIGLVTRKDNTEDVAQVLSQPMKANTCYKFSLMLAHSGNYVGHNQPVRIRVWGGQSGKEVLLATSPLVDHAEWRPYTFRFTTPYEIKVITFEAYYGPGVMFKYKGNILLDGCSPLEECVRA